MSASSIDRLSDQLGTLKPNTPDEKTWALLASLRRSTSDDEAAAFREALFGRKK